MSLDLIAYVRDCNACTNQAFERYAASLGLQVKLHPDVNLLTSDGYVPVRLTDARFAQNDGNDQFLTGFESMTGIVEEPLEFEVEGLSRELGMLCHEPLEAMIATLVGAFCVRKCGGAFYNTYTGDEYIDADELEQDLASYVCELVEEADEYDPGLIPFTGWD